MTQTSFVVCAALCVVSAVVVSAGDPSEGWLCYAAYTAKPTDIITKMKKSMDKRCLSLDLTVHETNTGQYERSTLLRECLGVQTARGDGALVQPIMAKWLGDGWYMFQEIFDWTNENDEQSRPIQVHPGDVITASISYVKESNSYLMNMTSSGTSQRSDFHYNLLPRQTETESVAYIVLEHQPLTCKELPSSGYVGWTDIQLSVNDEVVTSPEWVAKLEGPKCDSKAVVLSPSAVNITWTP